MTTPPFSKLLLSNNTESFPVTTMRRLNEAAPAFEAKFVSEACDNDVGALVLGAQGWRPGSAAI